MMKTTAIFLLLLATTSVFASEVPLTSVRVETSVAAVERGAEQFIGQCHSCHTLKYIRYRDLASFGMDKQKVDTWRADQTVEATLTSQMPDEAAMQSFGKIPPDLSLMTKAREGGADYVYSYLLGYYVGKEGMPGNHIFPETKMPDILGVGGATEPAQRDELRAKARDIVSFLAWAADPHEGERHRLGYYVIAYLIVLTALMFVVKNRVWAKLK
jgi:ubiquinol-cytochrome c reductase cytochrome c1 subunit